MRKVLYSIVCQWVFEVWNIVFNIVIIDVFIKVNIVDVLFFDKILLLDFVRLVDDFLLALVIFLYSESEESDFIGFLDIED